MRRNTRESDESRFEFFGNGVACRNPSKINEHDGKVCIFVRDCLGYHLQRLSKFSTPQNASCHPPALQGHQAVKTILETSFYHLVDSSLKTDVWYLYECCSPAGQNKNSTTADERSLNSTVPPCNPARPWNLQPAPMSPSVTKSVTKDTNKT